MNEDAVIKVRESGPYRVTGRVTVIDADGVPYAVDGENVALCRCGGSNTKPFCDGSHRENGFCAVERAPRPQESASNPEVRS
ncbi:MAG: CDGSH iron-sulfur domain-containing protein [Candidatus Eremiobacteraeota bacterium]|nr:CDGSH iron-sulfur domain-containing protein [Candidatus Eremiobacteraeota bacterium]MBV8374571.1 CDGSH iron-sulfur domain-containing protein [Candidatus Eremiobacteraeota bacterium]